METTWSWTVTGYSHLHRSHEDIRRTCLHAGLSGVEGSAELFAGLNDSELEALADAYAADGLRFDSFHLPFAREDDIASFYESTRRQAADKAGEWIERAGRLGVRAVIQHPTTCRDNVEADGLEPFLTQLGKSLDSMLERAAGCDVTIAIENMLPGDDGGRLGSRPEHFERFACAFDHPNLGFCLDTGHALVAGRENAHAFPAAMGERLVAFHLADNAGDRDSHLAPGHGRVEWGHVFRAAHDLGHAGSMCIETPPFDFGPDYTDDAWKKLVDDTSALAQDI
ncbi:MAG TPA: sugar phosphate isomerase/epimerase family protein [Candidatus Latescibacteria bacterium]|jgi:sugar phosphate isomerase/epimerase|nr:hypothetical protein [Gemmatimonadaceae bacterium]MDP6017145.1 sugar phosphate isomerase/epimerase family protein [Candidatus Latescibacterota bacterium]HJP29807.1 sugar phosphate isomerase/epimerase family protein [Candidatus Latescibacterota bacterium]